MSETIQEINIQNIRIIEMLRTANVPREGHGYEALKAQIISDGGIRDPAVLWLIEEPFIYDGEEIEGLAMVEGFTRYQIAVELGYKVLKAVLKKFTSIEHAKYWIILNQNSRRNLTDDQKTYQMGNLFNELKGDEVKLAAFRAATGVDVGPALNNRVNEVLASYYGVDEKTVRRSSKYATGLGQVLVHMPQVGNAILQGSDIQEGSLKYRVNRATVERLAEVELNGLGSWREVLDKLSGTGKSADSNPAAEIRNSLKTFLSSPTEENEKILRQMLTEFRKNSRSLKKTG